MIIPLDPIVTPVLVSAALATAQVGAGFIAVEAAVIAVAATAASAAASYFLASKAPSPIIAGETAAIAEPLAVSTSLSISPANQSREIIVRQDLPARRMAFGECRIAGPLFFQDVSEEYLYIGALLTDGKVTGPSRWFNGEYEVTVNGSGDAVTGNRYAGRMRVEAGNGGVSQVVSPLLSGAFPATASANFKQTNVARFVVRLDWGADAEQHGFLWSEIAPSVFGRWLHCYDPRQPSHVFSDATTWTYSDNPAICVAHALTQYWSRPLPFSAIDWDTVAEAADDCDTIGFKIAGVIESNTSFPAQLAEMLSSFGGSITYFNGKYQIRADKARASELTLTDIDLLGIENADLDADVTRTFTAIKAVYRSAELLGRTSETPTLIAPGVGPLETSRTVALNLPFTPDARSAQILAYRHMLYARDGRNITFRFTDAGAFIRPSSVFTIQSDTFPLLNGEYSCTQVDLAGSGVIVAARRYVPGAYVDPATYVM